MRTVPGRANGPDAPGQPANLVRSSLAHNGRRRDWGRQNQSGDEVNELHGRILTPSGLIRGTVRFSERIEGIEPAEVDGPLLLPGFVDCHVHGGGGGDTMDCAQGVRTLARFHLEHGTTTLLPTTITNPWEKVLAALDGVAQVRAEVRGEGRGEVHVEVRGEGHAANHDPILPDIPGAHLEGPFISPGRLGAQPPYTLLPEPEFLREVTQRGVVRLVTLAPEIKGALEAAKAFVAEGVRVSIGHTNADYQTVVELARAVHESGGTLGFTHLFNAMSGIAGREPGTAGAALALVDGYAELIYDRHHIAEGSLHVARAAKPGRLLFVTDCIRAGGLGDGETELGGQKVTVSGGAARLDDGTLAGSVLTLDLALRNALAAGVPLPEASSMLSAAPARYLGLTDRGEIALGKRADIVALDDDFRVAEVYVAGRRAGSVRG